jgi:hypothetical protein
MERSEFQIAASAARFDGGRDYRRETAPATVAELRVVEAREAVLQEARRRLAEELGVDEASLAAVPDGPGVERDWAGNVVRRPTKRVEVKATVVRG